MQGVKQLVGTALVVAASLCALWSARGDGLADQQIFAWTACQMEVAPSSALPPIRFVDRSTLRGVFLANNHSAYLRWEDVYGPARARKILRRYLEEVIGLFDSRSGTIYVGAFLSPCRRQAVLAHEMVHYFQNAAGRASATAPGSADPLLLKKEAEAYRIEKRFTRTFCSERAPLPDP